MLVRSTLAAQLAMMEALRAVGGDLEAASLMLFVNPVAVTRNLVVGDLTEASFDGYVRAAGLDFGAPYISPDDVVSMTAPSVQFTATDGDPAQVVYGWALVNAAKTELYFVALLDEPVSLDRAAKAVIIEPTVTYGA